MVMEIPLTFAMILIQYLFAYFMMDLQGNFIFMVLAGFGLGMVSNSVAMTLGCIVPDVKDVTELVPLAFVPQMLYGGFFIRISQVPTFLRWAQYIVALKYSMNLLYLTEFHPSLPFCQSSSTAEMRCKMLIELNDIDSERYYIYIILLIVLFLVFRLLGGFILFQKAKRF